MMRTGISRLFNVIPPEEFATYRQPLNVTENTAEKVFHRVAGMASSALWLTATKYI